MKPKRIIRDYLAIVLVAIFLFFTIKRIIEVLGF
jgi:hypothetical protein